MFDWQAIGIKVYGKQSGEWKTVCPKCSADRKKSKEKCLNVNLTDGVYKCHHCEWSGKAGKIGARNNGDISRHWERPRKSYTRPNYTPRQEPPADKMLAFFASRGISAEVVKRNQIERRDAWIPALGESAPCIAFPYFRDGQVVNVKYRTACKNFAMEKGAEPCLYGLDDIDDHETLIWVEGEFDKLACEMAGILNCVSVPNGADSDLDCIGPDIDRLAHVTRHIIAVDNDDKGRKLQQNLISRIGRDKCWLVEWPDECKDANEVLIKSGAEAIQAAIADAKPIPIEGLFEINDVREQVFDLWERGTPQGVDCGWKALSDLYRPRLGTWTAVISIPKSGKTAWMAALMVNLARLHGWRFAVFPAENLPAEEYVSLLAEIYLGLPFNRGYHQRMTKSELASAMDWLHEHFVILSPTDEERNLDSLLSIAKSYCLRRGIQGLVIDPFNELEIVQPPGITETQFIGRCLIKIRQFAKIHNIHIWVIIHPTKLQKDKDGKYPVPTLYDGNGSSHWRNKCDYGIAIYRHFDEPERPTEIHVQAIRWKGTGEIGMAELYYDRLSGRYSEQPTEWRVAGTPEAPARGFHDPKFADYQREMEARLDGEEYEF